MTIESIELNAQEVEFINGYIEAINFTECGDTDQPEHGAELDEDYARKCAIECTAFYDLIAGRLSRCKASPAQAGHDYWLTRNGHGVGYWDRPELYANTYATVFTRLAVASGESGAIFCEADTPSWPIEDADQVNSAFRQYASETGLTVIDGNQNKQNATTRSAYVDFVDGLERDNKISRGLAHSVTYS